jgi:hypothetical protein
MNVSPDSHMPGWQGLTIKEILEKVDLFNISTLVEEEKKNIAETDDVKVTILDPKIRHLSTDEIKTAFQFLAQINH